MDPLEGRHGKCLDYLTSSCIYQASVRAQRMADIPRPLCAWRARTQITSAPSSPAPAFALVHATGAESLDNYTLVPL